MKTLLTFISILIIFLMIHMANGTQPVKETQDMLCVESWVPYPGGLSYYLAEHCIGEFGVIEVNTGALTPDRYDHYIGQYLDSLYDQAVHQGVITIERKEDLYEGRE